MYINRFRGSLGVEWKINKHNSLDLYFLGDYVQDVNIDTDKTQQWLKSRLIDKGFISTIGLGYWLGIAWQNFNLFVGMCVLGVILGIVAFFVVRNIKHAPAEEIEEEEEVPAATRKRSSTSKKTARTTKPAAKKGTNTGERRTTRTEKASAQAYISEVETLMDKMAEATTVEELDKAHAEILDIMYTNIKPLDVKVMGLEFKDALAAIERDYAEGLKQLGS